MTFLLFSGRLTDAMKALIAKFFDVIPNVIFALVIFIVGYILAKIIAKIVKKFLQRLQVDQLSDKLNEIDIVHRSNVKISISGLASKVLYYLMLLFFLVAATDVLGMASVSNLVMSIFNFLPNLLAALLVLVVGLFLAELIRSIVHTACESLGIPSAKIISTFLFYFLFINVVIVALGQAKINTSFLSQNLTTVIAGGVLAFAIGYGLASKDVVANFLGSFYSQGKFDVGDRVTIEGDTGEIIEINRNSVTLQSGDRRIIYPLSKVTNSKIEIHS